MSDVYIEKLCEKINVGCWFFFKFVQLFIIQMQCFVLSLSNNDFHRRSAQRMSQI